MIVLAILMFGMGCQAQRDSTSRRPNIVLIYVDDMGTELGCYGNPVIRTPNIDRIAEQGTRFERAYTVTPSCSASRAALLTGRYPHANGVKSLIQWHRRPDRHLYPHRIERTQRHSLKRTETIIAQTLKKLGYTTGILGKWHVSVDPVTDWGFDEVWAEPEEFIAKNKDKPFFYYHTLVHTHEPFWASPDFPYSPEEVVLPPYFSENPDLRKDLAVYYSAISNQDREIGRILDSLDREGIAGNTIVIFSSDNGPPYARAKATLYEWGIRTPLIVRYPDRLPHGQTTKALAATIDIYPTLLEILGEKVPDRIQGRSLWPVLTGARNEVREALFAELNCHGYYNPMRSVRQMQWKYIRNFDPQVPFYTTKEKLGLGLLKHPLAVPPRPEEELYNLDADPLEGKNLAADPGYAEQLQDMRGLLSGWMEETADDPIQDLNDVTWEETYPGGWFGRPEDPAPNSRPVTEISDIEKNFDTFRRHFNWVAGIPSQQTDSQ